MRDAVLFLAANEKSGDVARATFLFVKCWIRSMQAPMQIA
jgi:hypothetical protein